MVQKCLAGRGVPLLALRILLEGFNDFACKITIHTRLILRGCRNDHQSPRCCEQWTVHASANVFLWGGHRILSDSRAEYFVFQTSSSIAFLSSPSTIPPKATGLVYRIYTSMTYKGVGGGITLKRDSEKRCLWQSQQMRV